MKKILIAAVLVAWAGTIYGAYAWGSNKGPSDSMISAAESRATLCSIGREDFRDANRALDNVVSVTGKYSLPLRAWGRKHPDTSLGKEAAYQENRRLTAGDWITTSCFPED